MYDVEFEMGALIFHSGGPPKMPRIKKRMILN